MEIFGELIGYVAGICTAVTFMPQSIKTIKERDVKGLSLASYVIYFIGLVSWIIYGLYLHSVQMILFNSIALIFACIILYMIIFTKK